MIALRMCSILIVDTYKQQALNIFVCNVMCVLNILLWNRADYAGSDRFLFLFHIGRSLDAE